MADQPERKMDSFGSEDMAIPELKLVQNVGGDEAKEMGAVPGDLYCTLTGEIYKGNEGLEIVIVDMRKTRTYWGRDEIEDIAPQCASLDADSLESTDGRDCRTCEYRADTAWNLTVAERRAKCLINYNVVAIQVSNKMPILVRASGISTTPVRELLTQLRMNRELKGEYHKALIKVTSKQKKTPSGEAYAFDFKVVGLIEDKETSSEMLQLTTQLLGTTLSLPESPEPALAEPAEPSSADELLEEAAKVVEQVAETKPVVKPALPAPKPAKKIDTDF